MKRALALVAGLSCAAGCECSEPHPVASGSSTSGAASAQAAQRATSVFGLGPAHPYERAFETLFAQPLDIRVPPCAAGPAGGAGCDRLDQAGFGSATVETRVLDGGDRSTVLMRADVDMLRVAPRRQETAERLEALRRSGPGDNPVSAALLQNDLWDRFDKLAAREGGASSELLSEIAAAMRAIALPAEALRGLEPNLGEAARAYGQTLDGLDTGLGWLELQGCEEGRPVGLRTSHATAVRHRAAVRVLVSTPPGYEAADLSRALAQPITTPLELPAGSRVVLLESPLALSDRGEPVTLPLVGLIEARTVRRRSDPAPVALSDLGFEVFEGGRAAMGTRPRDHGGVEPLPIGHLLPEGISVIPVLQGRRAPFPAACLACHDARGADLFTSRDGQALCIVPPDSRIQARWAEDQKRRDEQLALLLASFESAP